MNVMKKRSKYNFTPAMDDTIKKSYLDGRPGHTLALARVLNMPKWRVIRRANELGIRTPRKKELPWEKGELKILKAYAHRLPSYIHKKLKEAGYHRTEVGILLKRKRMRMLSNLGGMSAHQVALFLGVDDHWVTDKIHAGVLTAEKRGTRRTKKQGGDVWFIKEGELRQFIVNNPEIIDIRKVEKIYFIELLANGGVHVR